MKTTILFRPVGKAELDLIAASHWKHFPPRLPDQPIFYPVCNEHYARQIAKEWNAKDGAGYVTRFHIDPKFLDKREVHIVGAKEHAEYWIPAAELAAFNEAIIGPIEVIAKYP
jgi:hypothetical protein